VADDAVLDDHAAVLVTQVLEEVGHVLGAAVDDGRAVVRVPILVFGKGLLERNNGRFKTKKVCNDKIGVLRPVLKNIELKRSSKFERSLGYSVIENALKSCAIKLA
jgi:hypothetical protein